MTCAEFAAKLDAWAAGTLNDADARDVERHAAECATCGERLDAVSRVPELPLELAPPAPLRAATLRAVAHQRTTRRLRRVVSSVAAIAALVLIAIALQPRRKSASDFPRAGRELLARDHAKPDFDALDAAERDITDALRSQPDDAQLAAELARVRRQREALREIVTQVNQ